MRLADRIAQCRTAFVVKGTRDGKLTRLSGAAEFAAEIRDCPTRFVLSDDLVRLCTALAYSKGSRTLTCADLLHVPAETVWIEWCEAPRRQELERYGFATGPTEISTSGRRGALICSASNGRRGLMRSFWAKGDSELDVLASSMEAYFDFDTPGGRTPTPFDGQGMAAFTVFDEVDGGAGLLRDCFRFRFERTWSDYYADAGVTIAQRDCLAREALGTIAIDIPILLAFFLLLATRPSPPRKPIMLERVNRSRAKSGKRPLLEHIEVFSPLAPEFMSSKGRSLGAQRRARRLHHVRGHLVRRGSQLFWRVPHMRGSARAGRVRMRTVTWTVDRPEADSHHSPARAIRDEGLTPLH